MTAEETGGKCESSLADAWVCNLTLDPEGCVHGSASAADFQNEIKWSCSAGCDYDLCGSCVHRRQGAVGLAELLCPLGHLMAIYSRTTEISISGNVVKSEEGVQKRARKAPVL
jgi:hypothetical protein